jgi:hypothetical protein
MIQLDDRGDLFCPESLQRLLKIKAPDSAPARYALDPVPIGSAFRIGLLWIFFAFAFALRAWVGEASAAAVPAFRNALRV